MGSSACDRGGAARRGARGARSWGRCCRRRRLRRGRRLEHSAQSPARPRAAAKGGLDRCAACPPSSVRVGGPTLGTGPAPGPSPGPTPARQPEPPGPRWYLRVLLPSWSRPRAKHRNFLPTVASWGRGHPRCEDPS